MFLATRFKVFRVQSSKGRGQRSTTVAESEIDSGAAIDGFDFRLEGGLRYPFRSGSSSRYRRSLLMSLLPTGSRRIAFVIVAAVACLAAGACTSTPKSIGPANASQVPYQDWSCDQLSQELGRIDTTLTKSQKNAIEQVMITKNCIHPLAAETE